jgi:hypothetical protein
LSEAALLTIPIVQARTRFAPIQVSESEAGFESRAQMTEHLVESRTRRSESYSLFF